MEKLAEKFDNLIQTFIENNNLTEDIIEKLMIGLIDYKHNKEGELETKIKLLIKNE